MFAVALLVAIAIVVIAPAHAIAAQKFVLNDRCPPGFELEDSGTCALRSLYQAYPSLADQGVGGLKTGLPDVRDGFTPRQIDLGRYLFFDPILSSDSTVSCASCHDSGKAFTDGRARSIGITGTEVARSAPGLWNIAFQRRLFWDARASSLEEQMQGPLYSPDEMANSEQGVLASLNAIPAYQELFTQAFGDNTISIDEVYTAIAAFESSLVSLNSRYDQYAHGYHGALNADEIEGLNIFRSFVARCAECHTPPLFTNQQIAVIGTPEPDGRARDIGAEAVSGNPSQRGGFRVPSLRNIAKTAPYMHSGRFGTLRETVEFYSKGRGHAVPLGETLNIHWHIWEPDLSDAELDRIVDFLGALTDESFMPEIPGVLPSGLKPVTHE